ncbi:MAG: ClpX C4-type zinc finger protein [Chloroflexota bacterium]
MPGSDSGSVYRCSFCGAAHTETEYVINGPGNVFICSDCVAICNEKIERRKQVDALKPASGERLSSNQPEDPLLHARPELLDEADLPPTVIDNASAVERVKDIYLDIVNLGRLTLDQINRIRPVEPYASHSDYVRELWTRATAVATFAILAGLITADQWMQINREISEEHPDIPTPGPRNVI